MLRVQYSPIASSSQPPTCRFSYNGCQYTALYPPPPLLFGKGLTDVFLDLPTEGSCHATVLPQGNTKVRPLTSYFFWGELCTHRQEGPAGGVGCLVAGGTTSGYPGAPFILPGAGSYLLLGFPLRVPCLNRRQNGRLFYSGCSLPGPALYSWVSAVFIKSPAGYPMKAIELSAAWVIAPTAFHVLLNDYIMYITLAHALVYALKKFYFLFKRC